MKKILYLLLLITFASCGTSRKLLHNVSVYKLNGTVEDVILFSLRDSSLMVGTLTKSGDTAKVGDVKSIPFRDINFVMPNDGGAKYAVWGSLIAAAAGAAIGSVIPLSKPQGFISFPQLERSADVIGGFIVGALAGALIGYAIYDVNNTFYIDKKADREYLREISRYPEEEPEKLQKVK